MAKRFTDSDKYKKPFVRGLPGAYKLLWDYLYHDCDNAGIWIKDFEIAQLYIGSDMPISEAQALRYFGDRVVIFDNGKKWFIPAYIEFQYDCTPENLNPKNNAHLSVIKKLKKQGLMSPSQGAKDKDKDKEVDKDKEEDKVKDTSDQSLLEDYEMWTSQITEGNDQFFEQMFMKEMIPQSPNIQFWIMDHRDLLNRYPKMRPPNQDAFRKSCLKHIRENYKKPITPNGTTKKEQHAASNIEFVAKHYGAKSGN